MCLTEVHALSEVGVEATTWTRLAKMKKDENARAPAAPASLSLGLLRRVSTLFVCKERRGVRTGTPTADCSVGLFRAKAEKPRPDGTLSYWGRIHSSSEDANLLDINFCDSETT